MGAKYTYLLLLILLGCQTAVQTIPTSNLTPLDFPENKINITHPCTTIICPSNQACENGICKCTGKLCNTSCLPKDSCCTNADCSEGTCQNNTCVKECHVGEDPSLGCECASDRKYCPEQARCIPKNACCIHSQCSKFERCIPLALRTRLCIANENKTICRVLSDNKRQETVTLQNTTLRLIAIDFWQNGDITFNVNNNSLRIQPYQNILFENLTFYHENAEETGGYCREDFKE